MFRVMTNIFIINGYGVPKDIFKDDNYHFYLNMVFNQIWWFDRAHHDKKENVTLSLSKGGNNVLIIFSGGKTDCFPPYRRTEAGEMKKLFLHIMNRDSVKETTKHWTIVTQTKSLTTVENLVYGRELIYSLSGGSAKSKGLHYGSSATSSESINVSYFCESTRFERSHILSRKVFLKAWNPTVIPIDFDVSPQRYLNEALLNAREKKALEYELWALKSSKNLKAWREVYQERIKFLRNAGQKANHEAVKEWLEKRLVSLPIPK